MTATVAGIDGCAGGWVVATVGVDEARIDGVKRVADLTPVLEALDGETLLAAGVDMVIGLPAIGPRRCDLEARRTIGARRSSVFPAPIRAMLDATSYEDAASTGRRIQGKGLSRQAYGILSKIREVDRLMLPERQRQLVEVHPEVSFATLAGHPMASHKSSDAGRAERLDALRTAFGDVDDHVHRRIPGCRPDDVLDALVVAWSAIRFTRRVHRQLGGDVDARGLRMEIIA